MALMMLPIGASAVTRADQTTLTLAGGDSISITCNGILRVEDQTNTGANVFCDSAATATPTSTVTTTPTKTAVPTNIPTNTPVITAVPATPVATVTPQPITSGLWISTAEVQALPMSGSAWDNLKAKALGSWGTANLKDLNSNHDVLTLAGALYYARTGDAAMRTKVANAIMSAPETENGGRTLEPSRNIVSYVISADLINLAQYDATKNNQFKTWLANVRNETLDGKTIISTHEDRPNNWGTHAGATRVAIDRYIGDLTDLDKAAKVFHGWLGSRDIYAGFDYGELSWQSDPAHPVGINPKDAMIQNHNVDGVLPDDQRRGGGFTWPPFKENYAWEAMQGATVQAQLLARAGYDVWNWNDKAMFRAVNWLYTVDNYAPTGDDTWIPWVINNAYGTNFATTAAAIGKNMSYTDYTHR